MFRLTPTLYLSAHFQKVIIRLFVRTITHFKRKYTLNKKKKFLTIIFHVYWNGNVYKEQNRAPVRVLDIFYGTVINGSRLRYVRICACIHVYIDCVFTVHVLYIYQKYEHLVYNYTYKYAPIHTTLMNYIFLCAIQNTSDRRSCVRIFAFEHVHKSQCL